MYNKIMTIEDQIRDDINREVNILQYDINREAA